MTDGYAAYNQLQREGYPHGKVNHNYNFVNPLTGKELELLII